MALDYPILDYPIFERMRHWSFRRSGGCDIGHCDIQDDATLVILKKDNLI